MAKKQEKESYAQTKAAQETAGQRAAQSYAPAEAGYEEFAKTGGVSPEQEALARRQTSYGIGSLYGAMQRNLGRRARVQGGYAPGLAAGQAQLGRQGAEEIAKGLTGTNLGLLEMQRQGRLAGIGGLSGLYGTSAGLQQGLLGQQSSNAFRLKSGLGRVAGAFGDIGDIAGTIGGIGSAFYGA